jgi:hypothetical protein
MNECFSSTKVTNRTLNYRPLLPPNIRLSRDWHRVYTSALALCFSPSRRCLKKTKVDFSSLLSSQVSAMKPTIPRIVDESSHLCECLSSTKVRNRTLNYRPGFQYEAKKASASLTLKKKKVNYVLQQLHAFDEKVNFTIQLLCLSSLVFIATTYFLVAILDHTS